MPGSSDLHMVIPDTVPEGSYIARMEEALRRIGRPAAVHRLRGARGRVDRCTALAADIVLARLPDGAEVLLDAGLLPNLAAAVALDCRRLRLVALADGCAADRGDLPPEQADVCRHLERGALAQMRRVAVPEPSIAAGLRRLGIPDDRMVVAPPDDAGAVLLLDRTAAGRMLCHNA